MQAWWNKNTVLTLLLVGVAVAIILRITPPFVSDVVELKIVKNKTPISRIDQEREPDYQRRVWVDRLDLFHKNQLRHPKLGQLGYTDNFFIDIDHTFEVLEGGRYRFLIGSDDGFVAKIDGEELCSFKADRPYRKQTCMVELSEGEHRFEMSYFQGGGFSGFSVEYMPVGAERPHFFGEDSEAVRF